MVWEEVFTLEASVSGDDYYAKYTASTDGATMELMRLAGQSYYRDSIDGAGWEFLDFPLASIDRNLSVLGDTPTCPDLTNVTKVGDEVLNGVAVTKYTSGDGKPAPLAADFRGSKRGDLFEYWVDGRGQLLQIYNEHYIAAHYEGSAEGKTTGVYRITTTFSGVGEPNTITAPTLGQ